MKIARLSVCVVLVASVGSACLPVKSRIPGVLDLRSDAADAPINYDEVPKSGQRAGFDSFAYGAGVAGSGDITIEDRNHYVVGFFPIMNESSAEEWKAALGDGALRNIAITEAFTPMAWLVGIAKGCIPCVGGFITGTYDFRARATRVQTVSSVREESIVPPGTTPIEDESVPPPLGDAVTTPVLPSQRY